MDRFLAHLFAVAEPKFLLFVQKYCSAVLIRGGWWNVSGAMTTQLQYQHLAFIMRENRRQTRAIHRS